MSVDTLHRTYAPIMRFSVGENFFPMSVDDFLGYSALYHKSRKKPLLTAGQLNAERLASHQGDGDVFVRSVTEGPILGREVIKQWGKDAFGLLAHTLLDPHPKWDQQVAHTAYTWLSNKTESAAQRFWWNDLLLPQVAKDMKKGVYSPLPRFVLSSKTREDAINRYSESQGERPRFTYYYRTLEQDGYLNVQYWFYYAYNDWGNGFGGFNDHEGDWEGFHLFFKLDGQRPVEPPAYVCYLGHHSRITKPWGHPDIEIIGTHPVINVAAGSHASYPERKEYPLMALYRLVDYATGDAYTLDHSEWVNRIPLETQPWLNAYNGSWGTRYWLTLRLLNLASLNFSVALPDEIALPGVSAPRGPRYSDDGKDREVWTNPLAFAAL